MQILPQFGVPLHQTGRKARGRSQVPAKGSGDFGLTDCEDRPESRASRQATKNKTITGNFPVCRSGVYKGEASVSLWFFRATGIFHRAPDTIPGGFWVNLANFCLHSSLPPGSGLLRFLHELGAKSAHTFGISPLRKSLDRPTRIERSRPSAGKMETWQRGREFPAVGFRFLCFSGRLNIGSERNILLEYGCGATLYKGLNKLR